MRTFFILFTHNFHPRTSTVRFIHIHGKSFPIQFDSFFPRRKTRNEKNFKFSHLSHEKRERVRDDGGDEVRLYWNWIESAEFRASYWEFFLCFRITVCVCMEKKVYPFFCSAYIFLINAALLLRSSIFDAKIPHFAA